MSIIPGRARGTEWGVLAQVEVRETTSGESLHLPI